MMSIRSYILQSLRHRRRANAVVLLGVMTGSAVLTGALLVGDSMRGSLRERALSRLGGVDFMFSAPTGFKDDLPERFLSHEKFHSRTVGVLLLSASAHHPTTKTRASGIHVVGIEPDFWNLAHDPQLTTAATEALAGVQPTAPDRTDVCAMTEALARELGLNTGDEVVLSLPLSSDAPHESLLGRRHQTTVTTRLAVAAILPDRDIAGFNPSFNVGVARNVFVPRIGLGRLTRNPGRINLVLFRYPHLCDGTSTATLFDPRRLLSYLQLDDFGLQIRLDGAQAYIALEFQSLLIPPAAEVSALRAAEHIGASTASILAYLANDIETADGKSVPYSIVAGIDAPSQWWAQARDVAGQPLPLLEADDIFINAWTAQQLDAKVGDELTLRYFLSRGMAGLTTQEAAFRVAAILPMDGPLLDAGFAPTYPGITDARKLSDWDPPFPFDFKKIRDDDEAYWDRYRAAPKAFVNLARAQALWADQPERHGRLTSIRLLPKEGQPLAELAQQFEKQFLTSVDPADFGFVVDPVRRRALEASQGTTDFSGLFVGFSFFLIASAAMLVALLFRLSVEQRAREIGLLSAVGFATARIRRILLDEGAAIASVGSVLGLPVACGYAWLMLAGLRTWWSGAVSAPFLTLHVTASSMAIGWAAATVVALGSMALALRGVLTLSTRGLLSGAVAASVRSRASGAQARWIAAGCGAGAVLAAAIAWPLRNTDHAPMAFFFVGVLALVAGLAVAALRLNVVRPMTARPGRGAWVRMGIGNAPRHRGRSLLTIALIASATFLVSSLAAFRLNVDDSTDRPQAAEVSSQASSPQQAAAALTTGAGGFALLAETTSPLPYDISTEQGRKELDLPDETLELLDRSRVFPFRLQRGDETSCQSLYAPTRPRILGASAAFIARGGFAFSSYMKDKLPPDGSPWNLLDVTFADGAIPAIGDEASVRWQLHAGLGRDLEIEDESGRKVALRFVALLKGSALQSELIVGEAAFVRLFPSNSGHGFFLIEAPRETGAQRPEAPQAEPHGIHPQAQAEKAKSPGAPQAELGRLLERDLSRFGFDAMPVRRRMEGYFAVQNTYLATFQTLGGFGLVLGTIGLTVVLLRNVFERRAELALMQALGFSPSALTWIVLAENVALTLAGLIIGLYAAALAIAPHFAASTGNLSLTGTLATVAGVLATTLLTGYLALLPTLRGSLISALRSE